MKMRDMMGNIIIKKRKQKFNPNSAYIHNAINEYTKSGGKIKKIEIIPLEYEHVEDLENDSAHHLLIENKVSIRSTYFNSIPTVQSYRIGNVC